ncbi:unnamed protein product, partial [Rotaria socialis]
RLTSNSNATSQVDCSSGRIVQELCGSLQEESVPNIPQTHRSGARRVQKRQILKC